MAGNPVPRLQDDLLALAEDMADGCRKHEAAIGLQHNKEADMRAAITALRNTEAGFGRAKSNRQDAMDALHAVDDAATEFLGTARKMLATFLGNYWSRQWEATGFPDNSTQVPKSQEKRMNLCAALKIYFTNVPGHEASVMGVTAAIAETRFQAISDAREALALKEAAQTTARQARDTAFSTLRKRMSNLINELDTLMAPDDSRWHGFGLSMPADPNTPEPVESLTLTAGTTGAILAGWPPARRATRYRPFVQVEGVDPEFVARKAVHDLSVNLTGFRDGQTVNVYIVAANDAGEAPPSPTEQIIAP